MTTKLRKISAGDFIERIKTLNLDETESALLFNTLGILSSGKVNDSGPWNQAGPVELKAVLASFLYRLGKGSWKTTKALADEFLFLKEQEDKADLTDPIKNHKESNVLSIYTDGASRGNPGDAGIGVAVYDEEGNLLKEMGKYLGKTTNNVAEYNALMEGIKIALEFKAKKIKLYLDSELVVKQIKGIYKVKNENLKSLYNQVIKQLKQFEQFSIEHVPRTQNKKADQLANYGIDSFVKNDF